MICLPVCRGTRQDGRRVSVRGRRRQFELVTCGVRGKRQAANGTDCGRAAGQQTKPISNDLIKKTVSYFYAARLIQGIVT